MLNDVEEEGFLRGSPDRWIFLYMPFDNQVILSLVTSITFRLDLRKTTSVPNPMFGYLP